MCEYCANALMREFPQASNDERMFILWNMTAFPASDGKWTAKQIRELATRVKARKNGWRRRLDVEMKRREEEIYKALHP